MLQVRQQLMATPKASRLTFVQLPESRAVAVAGGLSVAPNDMEAGHLPGFFCSVDGYYACSAAWMEVKAPFSCRCASHRFASLQEQHDFTCRRPSYMYMPCTHTCIHTAQLHHESINFTMMNPFLEAHQFPDPGPSRCWSSAPNMRVHAEKEHVSRLFRNGPKTGRKAAPWRRLVMIHVVGNMASGCLAHIINQSFGPGKFYLSSSINR